MLADHLGWISHWKQLKKLNKNFKTTATTNWTRVILKTGHHSIRLKCTRKSSKPSPTFWATFSQEMLTDVYRDDWEASRDSNRLSRRGGPNSQSKTQEKGNREPSGTDPYLRSEREPGTSPHQMKAPPSIGSAADWLNVTGSHVIQVNTCHRQM